LHRRRAEPLPGQRAHRARRDLRDGGCSAGSRRAVPLRAGDGPACDPRPPALVDPREAARRDAALLGGRQPGPRAHQARGEGLRDRRAAGGGGDSGGGAGPLRRRPRSVRAGTGMPARHASHLAAPGIPRLLQPGAHRDARLRALPPARHAARVPGRRRGMDGVARGHAGGDERAAPRTGGGDRDRARGDPRRQLPRQPRAPRVRADRHRGAAGGRGAVAVTARRWELPAAVIAGVVVRYPFWREALKTPVDGDTAIIGLMARHPLRSVTMWGQPYGSPLEAWLAAPLMALLRPDAATLRLAYFLLGLALIPAAYALARALDARAALPAALLMACPAPYFLMLSALPPPMYPTALLLCAVLLVLAFRLGARLIEGRQPAAGLALWGALAGL